MHFLPYNNFLDVLIFAVVLCVFCPSLCLYLKMVSLGNLSFINICVYIKYLYLYINCVYFLHIVIIVESWSLSQYQSLKCLLFHRDSCERLTVLPYSSPASFLFTLSFFSACFAFKLAQDTVSDPGVCVADIKAKLYLYSVLRHWQSPALPEGKELLADFWYYCCSSLNA